MRGVTSRASRCPRGRRQGRAGGAASGTLRFPRLQPLRGRAGRGRGAHLPAPGRVGGAAAGRRAPGGRAGGGEARPRGADVTPALGPGERGARGPAARLGTVTKAGSVARRGPRGRAGQAGPRRGARGAAQARCGASVCNFTLFRRPGAGQAWPARLRKRSHLSGVRGDSRGGPDGPAAQARPLPPRGVHRVTKEQAPDPRVRWLRLGPTWLASHKRDFRRGPSRAASGRGPSLRPGPGVGVGQGWARGRMAPTAVLRGIFNQPVAARGVFWCRNVFL